MCSGYSIHADHARERIHKNIDMEMVTAYWKMVLLHNWHSHVCRASAGWRPVAKAIKFDSYLYHPKLKAHELKLVDSTNFPGCQPSLIRVNLRNNVGWIRLLLP